MSLPSIKTWMEGTYDIPYRNLYFFLQFHNPKAYIYSDLFTILETIDAESPIVFFFLGGGGQTVQYMGPLLQVITIVNWDHFNAN